MKPSQAIVILLQVHTFLTTRLIQRNSEVYFTWNDHKLFFFSISTTVAHNIRSLIGSLVYVSIFLIFLPYLIMYLL